MDPALEQAGQMLHGPRWVVRRVTLPLVRPEIVGAALLIFALAVVNYTVPSLLRVQTYPIEIFAAFSGLFNRNGALALALPLLLLGGLAVIAAIMTVTRRPHGVTPTREGRITLIDLGRNRSILGLAGVAMMVLLTGVPIVGVLNLLQGPADVVRAYTLASEPVWTTVILAMCAALLLSLLAFPAAYLLVRSRGFVSLVSGLFYLLPLAITPTVLGIGMIRAWNHPALWWLTEGPAILLVACVAQFIPYAVAPQAASLSQLAVEQEEAGVVSGMGWWTRVRRILFLLTWPGFVAAWVLVFSLCLDEVGASILVLPAGIETLGVRIYNLAHYSATDVVAGLCVIVLLISLVPFVAYLAIMKATPRRGKGSSFPI
jgi:iron(III) transport system permease protein